MKITNQNKQIHLCDGNNCNPSPGYTNSSISGDSEVFSIYTPFVCGTDGHFYRFCSWMWYLAECCFSSNMLYPHGLPCPIKNNSHEQDVQAVDHHIEKGDKPCTQLSSKCTKMRHRFWAYSEVMSDEDVSSKDLIFEPQDTIHRTAGQTCQDQSEWLKTKNRIDEPYLHDHLSNWPLPQESQFCSIANVSNGEFQGKYIHFNLIPKSDDFDQRKVSELLVQEIAPHHAMNTPMKLVWHHHRSIYLLTGKSVHCWHTLHMQQSIHSPVQISYLAKKASNPIVHLPLVRHQSFT